MANPDPAAATTRHLMVLILLLTLWHLGLARLLPITQDEAYYFDWARTLSWGYFHHPPGVALLGVTGLLAPGSALAARLGTVIAATLTLIVLAAFYRRCGLRYGSAPLIALVSVATTAPGLAGGSDHPGYGAGPVLGAGPARGLGGAPGGPQALADGRPCHRAWAPGQIPHGPDRSRLPLGPGAQRPQGPADPLALPGRAAGPVGLQPTSSGAPTTTG